MTAALPEWVRFFSTALATFAVCMSLSSLLYSRHSLRCALRREVAAQTGMWELADALTRRDYDAAVTAYARNLEAKVIEDFAQARHPFRPWTFWRMPPKIGEPWPDAKDDFRQAALFN